MNTRERHANIALFVTHQGCPYRCSFCNQVTITGALTTATPEDVKNAVETAKAHGRKEAQLAFFGGSFTLVERDYMISLLEAARPYLAEGSLTGIRISTRPDGIDPAMLDLLASYGVDAIELGAQSMVDEVLARNHRGHTAQQIVVAATLIKERGFELGLQMMTGLYGSTPEQDLFTADQFIRLEPDTVRVYPTVVLEHTELHQLMKQGFYAPQTLEEAIPLCGELLQKFHEAGIPVIRLGLHSGGGVEEGYVAGPWHPALRELAEGYLYFNKAKELLSDYPVGAYRLWVAPSEISKMTGQKRKNIIELNSMGYAIQVAPKEGLSAYQIQVEEKD